MPKPGMFKVEAGGGSNPESIFRPWTTEYNVTINHRSSFVYTVKPRFTNLIRHQRSFVNRNVRKPKLFFP